MTGDLSTSKASRSKAVESADEVLRRRHHEYSANVDSWRHLRDSILGAQVYRTATYGVDPYGFPIHNLKRHKRERMSPRDYGSPNPQVAAGGMSEITLYEASVGGVSGGSPDPYRHAGDDDFQLRRARTPVPCVVEDVIGKHRDRIYSSEVKREGPADLEAFWEDVDGRGTPIDSFMKFEVAPLFLVEGFVDLLFENPQAPAGVPIATQADVASLGLEACRVSVIQPDNLVNWSVHPDGSFRTATVIERYDDPETGAARLRIRIWTEDHVTVYRVQQSDDGLTVADDEDPSGKRQDNPYGLVPIRRVFDTRKIGSTHVGKSAYEGVADRNREIYNLMSELMISDTNQAHPILCMPEDYCKSDDAVATGPSWVMPMKKHDEGNGYTPPMYLTPEKGPADSLRTNIALHTIEAYRIACLDAPEGLESLAGRFSDQSSASGIAKAIDQESLNSFLRMRASGLGRVERAIIGGWEVCARKKSGDARVTYPAAFGAWQPQQLIGALSAMGQTYEQMGRLPESEKLILDRTIRGILTDLQDDEYKPLQEEIGGFIDDLAKLYDKQVEFKSANPMAMLDASGVVKAASQHVPEGSGQPEAHKGNSVPKLDAKAPA